MTFSEKVKKVRDKYKSVNMKYANHAHKTLVDEYNALKGEYNKVLDINELLKAEVKKLKNDDVKKKQEFNEQGSYIKKLVGGKFWKIPKTK